MKKLVLLCSILATAAIMAEAQVLNNSNSNHANKFEQLGTLLPDPNATGYPASRSE
jgi:hypothetical protein